VLFSIRDFSKKRFLGGILLTTAALSALGLHPSAGSDHLRLATLQTLSTLCLSILFGDYLSLLPLVSLIYPMAILNPDCSLLAKVTLVVYQLGFQYLIMKFTHTLEQVVKYTKTKRTANGTDEEINKREAKKGIIN
jgi:hypothetical protein